MIPDAEKARLRELCDAATPGPWTCYNAGPGDWPIETGEPADDYLGACPDCGVRPGFEDADAHLIIAARDALPRLLDENAEQAAEVDKVSCLLAGARARGDQLERNWEQLIGPLLHTLDPDGDEDLTGEAPSEIIAAVAEQAAEIARLRAEVERWREIAKRNGDMYREAVGTPVPEHLARRMESIAETWEAALARATCAEAERDQAQAALRRVEALRDATDPGTTQD